MVCPVSSRRSLSFEVDMLILEGDGRGEEREIFLLAPGVPVPTEWEKCDGDIVRVRCWLPELTLERLEGQIDPRNDQFTLAWTEWLRWLRKRLIMLIMLSLLSWLLAVASKVLL